MTLVGSLTKDGANLHVKCASRGFVREHQSGMAQGHPIRQMPQTPGLPKTPRNTKRWATARIGAKVNIKYASRGFAPSRPCFRLR